MTAPRYASLAGITFLLIAILHLGRILAGWAATIGRWSVPMWLSWIALIISGCLAITGVRLGRTPPR